MDELETKEELAELVGAVADQARVLRDFGVRHVAAAQPPPPLPVQDSAQVEDQSAPAVSREPGAPPRPAEPQSGRAQSHMFAPPSRQPPGESQDGSKGHKPSSLSPDEAQSKLQELGRGLLACSLCGLSQKRRNVVFGEGDPQARLVLVGEGPGQEEDRSGRPFVGPAGQLLERILLAMGLSREQVYICNVVKCRPPRNRTPEEREMRTCGQFLARQLDIIRPRHILCLGGTAAKYLLNTDKPMNQLRGRFFEHSSGARIMPTYHPAYLLRNAAAKRPVWEDVQLVMAEMKEAEQEK